MATTDRVGIEIDVLGYEEAVRKMEDLERRMRGLGKRKVYLEVQARIEALRKNLLALRSHKVKIQAETKDVNKKLREIRQKIQELQNTKMRMKLDGASKSDLNNMERKINKLRTDAAKLNSQKINIQTNLDKVNQEIREATAEMNRLKAAAQQVKSLSLGQIFKRVSSSVGHVGQAMQSIGNAITRMSYPMRMLTSGLVFGAGYSAIGKMTEGLSAGFERYDIMKKYPRMMEQFNTSSYNASKSIQDLEKSVLGLPTGLDEIVNLAQRFTMTTGDMERGTKLAIAANNAFLASMSTDTQKYQGMMQLQDVLGGKDMNAREWQALANSMMPAIRWMGQELGYTGKELDNWVASVQQGKVANEDFIKAMEKAGTGTGKVAKMAEYSKDTWQAFSSNVRIAFSRMTVGIIESLDELTRATTGKDLNQLLSKTIPTKIDELTKSAKKWIKANPDKITDFFNKLKSVDWKGIGKGMLDGISLMLKAVEKAADLFSGSKNANLFGKGLVLSGFVGSGITILGGLLKGSRHIIGGLTTIGIGLGRLFTGAGALLGAGALGKIGAGITGLIGRIKNIGKVKGAVTTTALDLQKANKKMGTIKGAFGSIVTSLSGLATVAGGVLIVGGTVWSSVKMIKDIMKDLGEISVIMEDIDPKALAVVGGALGSIVGVVNKAMKGGGLLGMTGKLTSKGALKSLAYVEGAILAVGALVTSVSGFAWANVKIIESTLGNVKKAVDYVVDIAKGINGLNGVEVNAAGMKTTVGAIAHAMLDITGTAEDGEDRWFDNSKVKKMKKIFGNISDIIDVVKTTANDLKRIGNVEIPKEAIANIKRIVGTKDKPGIMAKLYSDLQESFDVKTKSDVKGTDKGKTILDNISSMIDTIRQSVDDIKFLAKTKIDFDGAKQSIADIGTQMGELYSALYGAFAEPIGTAEVPIAPGSKATNGKKKTVATGGGINKNTIENSALLDGIIANISSTIETVKGVYDTINKGGFKNVNTEAFKEQIDNAKTMIHDISTMWEEILPDLKKFKKTEKSKENLANISATMKSMGDVMVELAQIGVNLKAGAFGETLGEAASPQLGQLPKQGAGPTGFIDMAIANIKNIISGIEEVSTQLAEIPEISTLSAKMEQVRLSVEKIKEISSTLTALGGEGGGLATAEGPAFTAIGNIKTLVQKLGEALNTEALASLKEQVDTFKQSITDMFTALNKDFANVEVTVNIKGEVTGHDLLISKVRRADAAIRSAVAAIKTSYYKEISVTLHGSVTRTGNFGGGLFPHTGGLATSRGLLYRRKGGDAPFGFKPKGTDTIPAMLTPGEYVHRKKAVDFWGVNMMRAINNMDVAGAMRAMSAKAGRVVNGVRNTVINNNTTNNNTANITQNIRTNNPNFAFRRSNRYVGAL